MGEKEQIESKETEVESFSKASSTGDSAENKHALRDMERAASLLRSIQLQLSSQVSSVEIGIRKYIR